MQVRNLTGCKPDRWVFHAGIFDGTVHSPSICATLPPMRNLTATLCLTITVILGNAVMYRNSNQSVVSTSVRNAHAE